jgi:hypothetical protein
MMIMQMDSLRETKYFPYPEVKIVVTTMTAIMGHVVLSTRQSGLLILLGINLN